MLRPVFLLALTFIFQSLVAQDLSEHLVAHWSFDESMRDSSQNAFDAEQTEIMYTNGAVGKAAVFNSPNDRIVIEDAEGLPPREIAELEIGSISLWFKYLNVGTNGNILPIFYYGESETDTPHNSLIIEIGHGQNAANRKLYFTIVNQRFCYDSKTNLEENQWYHFVAVVGADYNTGYLNGEEMTNRNYNLGSDATYSKFFADVPTRELLSVGYGRYGQQDPFYTYKGLIDDLRIYDKPLNKDEVEQLYALKEATGNNSGFETPPTFEAVKYGEYERNEIDFWQADTEGPAPVVVFIHGGGFINGSRLLARKQKSRDIERFLENGYSYASISYRLKSSSVDDLNEGTRLDTIMLDCARAIQFLRFKAEEWNIDPGRIGAYGGSAGGGASLWIGGFEDLADSDNPDPVLRESSRIQAVGHLNSQATYDWLLWPEVLDMDSTTVFSRVGKDDIETWQMQREEYNSEAGRKLGAYMDMLGHITADDPPVYTQNANINEVPGNVIHHPRHSIAVKNKCDEVGIECVLQLKDTPQDEKVDFVGWMIEKLTEAENTNSERPRTGFRIYPNPAGSRVNFSQDKTMHVEVYNASGLLVVKRELKSHDGLDVSGFLEGIYVVKAGVDQDVFVKRLMVRH